jgi:hypothetical protein
MPCGHGTLLNSSEKPAGLGIRATAYTREQFLSLWKEH